MEQPQADAFLDTALLPTSTAAILLRGLSRRGSADHISPCFVSRSHNEGGIQALAFLSFAESIFPWVSWREQPHRFLLATWAGPETASYKKNI